MFDFSLVYVGTYKKQGEFFYIYYIIQKLETDCLSLFDVICYSSNKKILQCVLIAFNHDVLSYLFLPRRCY